MHREEMGHMLGACEVLEKENLSMMSELFECTVDDLKICRCVSHLTIYFRYQCAVSLLET